MVQPHPTLKGKTIAITRPRGQAEEEATIIREMGGIPYFLPTIDIRTPNNDVPTKKVINALTERKFDYVIFMSANGVTHLLDAAQRMNKLTGLKAGLSACWVVAVGPRTAQALQANGIRVDAVPSTYTSEGVLELLKLRGVNGKRVCIPRTSAASPALNEVLVVLGAFVEEVYVYESALPVDDGLVARFLADLSAGRVDAIVFGSSMCVRNLLEMVNAGASVQNVVELLNRGAVVVAIGPVTAKTLLELGIKVDVVPDKHLFEDALVALAHYWACPSC
jgi:uroporphyrinogen-III synthase